MQNLNFARPIRATLATALIVVAPHAMAQAPAFTCPIRLELLSALSGTEGMDKPVYGLPVRHWTLNHLAQAQGQYESCQASTPGPQSLKAAERADAQRQFGLFRQALQQRDHALSLRAREQGAQSAAAEAGGAIAQSSGTLQWTYGVQAAGHDFSRTNTITCDEIGKLPKELLTLTPQSQQELPRLYTACVQTQQIQPGNASLFRATVDQLTRDRQAQAEFINTVQQAARQPDRQTHQSLLVLENAHKFVLSSDPRAQTASEQLAQLRQQVDVRECTAHVVRSGVPAELRSALYLWRFQEPTGFVGLLCEAVRNGASFRFSPKGMLYKDSFEVAAPGRKTVRVTLARQPMGDGKTVALVPVESRIEGRSADITRANWPQLTAALQEAIGVK